MTYQENLEAQLVGSLTCAVNRKKHRGNSTKIPITRDEYVTIAKTPEELRQEIKINSHLTIVDLKNHLQNKGFDISKYSPKRIYYWKFMAGRELFQRDDNYVESACKLL
ncbi:636_t:CDS:2, partial [Ambispora gerdemannii]